MSNPTTPLVPADTSPFIRGAAATHVIDADGACYVDCTGGTLIGRRHPFQLRTPNAGVGARLSDAAVSRLRLSDRWRSAVFATAREAVEACTAAAARLTGREEIVLLRSPVNDVHEVPFGDAAALSELLRRRPGQVAAVIAEPILSANVTAPAPDYWPRVRQMTASQDVLLIFDESHTALGRTGDMLAGPAFGTRPDAITLGNGLARCLSLAAVLASDKLLNLIDAPPAVNGHSLAALETVIDLVSQPAFARRVCDVGERLLAALTRLAERRPHVAQPRGMGLLLGVDATNHEYLLEALADHGVLATMSGHTLVLRPPLTIGDAEVTQIIDALHACL